MLLLAGIILLSGSLVGAVIYRRTGSEVVISSGSDAARITTITWKHNEDMAVEWYGGEPTAYRHFNGLTRDHSGFYTAEINNKVIGTTEVQVISPVPKPTVSKQCNAKMTYCTLTCEGHTTNSEPVTYSWEIFDVLNYYKGQQINLTKENHDPWYRCEMRNPISSETSEKFPNPFPSRNQTIIIILVLFFLFLFLSGLIAGIYIRRRCNSSQRSYSTMKFFSSKTAASNDQTATTTSESQEALTSAAETSNKSGNSPDQVQTNGEIPRSSALTENSQKKEEEVEVLIHNSEPPENNNQTENSQKKEEVEVQIHISELPESNNQTEKSAEESNVDETTRPLLEERNQIISVSA